MLDRLYLAFDALANKHEVFKVETIGDAWMGVTNRKLRHHMFLLCSYFMDYFPNTYYLAVSQWKETRPIPIPSVLPSSPWMLWKQPERF